MNKKTITEFLESGQAIDLVRQVIKKEQSHPSVSLGTHKSDVSGIAIAINRNLRVSLWLKLLEQSEKKVVLVPESANVEKIVCTFLKKGFPRKNLRYVGNGSCGHYRLLFDNCTLELIKNEYDSANANSVYRWDEPGKPGISAEDFVQLAYWFMDKLPELRAAADQIAYKLFADQMVRLIKRTARDAARG